MKNRHCPNLCIQLYWSDELRYTDIPNLKNKHTLQIRGKIKLKSGVLGSLSIGNALM